MDVSGTIDAILGQKGGEIFSVSPDATVYEAIDLMASRNVGALLVVEDGALLGMTLFRTAAAGRLSRIAARNVAFEMGDRGRLAGDNPLHQIAD